MIDTSFFQLFKIGPGPSSSHTVGPMIAAKRFREELSHWCSCNQVVVDEQFKIRVELFGALAATGRGHGTHRAVLSGLLGNTPTDVDVNELNALFNEKSRTYKLKWKNFEITFVEDDIFYDFTTLNLIHPNTLCFKLINKNKEQFSKTYFSVGGGFIEEKINTITEKKKINSQIPYPFKNMGELVRIILDQDIKIDDLLLKNEMAITGWSEKQIFSELDKIRLVMHESVQNGIKKEGVLPGGLNVQRRAKGMFEKSEMLSEKNRFADALFCKLNAYALATSEENADGQMVVTAPTNGAAGIIPSALEYLENDCKIDENIIRRGLLVAALIGFIIKDHASISGAELGCQAEVGSAASMAAALFAFCFDEDIYGISTAAEIAMEHHLGMTCDPIKGLVQVPCIERNANGVIKAYNAYLLASGRVGKPIISFDDVVEVMRQTGEDLSSKYKETAMGGLATSKNWEGMPGS